MKIRIAQLSLLVSALFLDVSAGYAQDGKANSAIVEIDAFSGQPNPVFYVDLTDASELSEAIRSLARDAKLKALTPETNNIKVTKAIYGYGGIVITDPSGDLMAADASIVIKSDTITTVRKETQTVYANTHPQLYKLLIKYAYQKGALDRRVALHLYGK